MFTLDSIGIEFEFNLPADRRNWFAGMTEYVNSMNAITPEYTIEIDTEYYDDQVEFKLRRCSNIDWGIAHFQAFLISLYEKFPVKATTSRHFVGTHIHLFLNKDWVPFNKFVKGKKIPLVRYAYTKMASWLLDWQKNYLNKQTARNEASRLTRNHNILRYFDAQIGDKLKKNLELISSSYQQFHSGTDRQKYTPVLWSLANETTWKPHSLEIRCVPNSYLLSSHSSDVEKYIRWVIDVLNSKDVSNSTDEIVSSHAVLLAI